MNDEIEVKGVGDEDLSPSTVSVVVFYLCFVAAALLWDFLRTGPSELIFYQGQTLLRDLMMGLGVGLCVVLLSRLGSRFVAPIRKLESDLAQVLGRLSYTDVFVYALMSSVGEEMFFRGAMQPAWGLLATALIFGFVHGGYVGRLWIWSLFALAIGFAFGWMFEYTTNLCAPIVAHFVVNGINLRLLTREQVGQEA
jgi:membrane protease YdiL (CAAX protease family)